jgi:Tfp pilus assembly protein PilW
MIHKENGYSLIELIVAMGLVLFVITAASNIFVNILGQFKQQGKISETQIEGVIGFDILRRDIEHAGLGLPWNTSDNVGVAVNWNTLTNYTEASAAPASDYNDAPANAPRAILSGNGIGPNGSDALVIKSTNVAITDTAHKWSHLGSDGILKLWDLANENFVTNDRVIVVSPGTTEDNERTLIVNGTVFSTLISYSGADAVVPAAFSPAEPTTTYLAYGLDPSTSPRMPFNRADYVISMLNTPSHCAPNTGVFVKTVVDHLDGDYDLNGDGVDDELPLFDCVADFQITYSMDTNDDGTIDLISDDITLMSAADIRDQVKEAMVTIVMQEGQKDMTYDFSMDNTRDSLATTNLSAIIGSPEFKYYRWKRYQMSVSLDNL